MISQLLAEAGEVSHDTLLTIIVSLFGLAISSPIAVMMIQSRRNARDREEDRLDRVEVAQRVADTAKELSVTVASTAENLSEVVNETNHQTTTSLKQIHAYVDGRLEAVRLQAKNAAYSELTAVRGALASINEVIALKEISGMEVLPETYIARSSLLSQISALERYLANEEHEEAYVNTYVKGEADSDIT